MNRGLTSKKWGISMLVDLRCTECGKLLGKAAKEYEAAPYNPDLELKCRKCGTINKYKSK